MTFGKVLFLAWLMLDGWMPFSSANPVPSQPLRVACVGDSITAGDGLAPDQSYPSQLQALLGDSYRVGNFGQGGATLLNKGDRPYTQEPVYRKALQFSPAIVIVHLGTNDTKPYNWKHQADFSGDYASLIQSFLNLPQPPRIYICRPIPVIGEGNWEILERGIQEQIPILDALAIRMKLGVIDMHAALEGRPDLIPDKVHPNPAGAGEMAKAAFRAITGKEAPSGPALPQPPAR